MTEFKTKNGEVLQGKIVKIYGAFEGDVRYIFSANGREYRCIKDSDGNYVELVI